MKDKYEQVVGIARTAFASGKTLPLSFREAQLKSLKKMMEENEKEILHALKLDLRKPEFEAKLGESENVKNEINTILRNLHKLAADDKLPKNILASLDKAYVRKEPFGVVLVLGAFNYPFSLTLKPLIGALSAGNTVILKPSEHAPNSAQTMARLLPRYLDSNCYQVVLGDVEDTKALLRHKFDYIFYTGSSTTARSIAAAAAVHLTPMTLELGGKSAVYVDDDADFRLAAKRIMWGKVMNLGMTCVAPDYILCSKKAEERFVSVAKEVLSEWYGGQMQKCQDLPRIVNQSHFNRLRKMLDSTNGRIVIGGFSDEDDLWIEPTIIVDVKADDSLMNDEIFGPLLPILTVDSVDEATRFINGRQSAPLALYIFTNNQRTSQTFIESTRSGNMCLNDVIWQNLWPGLPFGGVGESGYGNYHGKYSFSTFSHHRAILVRGFSYLSEKLGEARYPPYSNDKLRFFKFVIDYFDICNIGGTHVAIFILVIYLIIMLVLYLFGYM